jgi:hypothetical protein
MVRTQAGRSVPCETSANTVSGVMSVCDSTPSVHIQGTNYRGSFSAAVSQAFLRLSLPIELQSLEAYNFAKFFRFISYVVGLLRRLISNSPLSFSLVG